MRIFEYAYTGGTWRDPETDTGINPDVGFLVLNLFLLFCVNFWQSIRVGKARKRYGIDYPNAYAIAGTGHVFKHAPTDENAKILQKEAPNQADADAYNNVQRAHQNTLENHALYLALLFVGGVGFPAISSIFGFMWLLSRVLYTRGYYAGPKKRIRGAILGFLAMFCLAFLNLSFAIYIFKGAAPIKF